MSAKELFSVRSFLSDSLKANNYKPEVASQISNKLSEDTLCLIAELGLVLSA